jgi:integrase
MNLFAHHRPTSATTVASWSRKTCLATYYTDYSARQVWTPQSARAVDLAARTFPYADMPLRDLRRAHIETWIRTMHDAGLAPATTRTRVAHVRAILYGAVRDGIIDDNPAAGVKLPRATGRSTTMTLPTAQQVSELIRTAEEPYNLLFALAAYAGLRLGEARALTWADVDLNARVLHVRRQLQQLPGGGWSRTPPKYGSYRSVPIAEPLLPLLRVAEREEGRFVIEGVSGGPVHPASIQRRWAEGCRRVGLASGLHFHDLRHLYASRLIADGNNVLTVQRRLGHARASTTLDVYAHSLGNAL